ncbi:MAG: hypothetical protein NDI69_03220 [Bacteriovoracaceae bacterium]|nr:hypothetical protein [Bacteriovoracaceae bacterium]
MKSFKVLLFCLFVTPGLVLAEAEDCEYDQPLPVAAVELLDSLKKVSAGLYKDIATLKVNHDGEGKLSVYFENEIPKLIKLTYKNGSGTVVKQVSFDDLAKGKPLIYENPDKPGKAIVLEKGASFKEGNYDFKFKIRSKVSPEEFQTYSINFRPDLEAPKITYNNKSFNKMIISPGISMFNWDGTFTKVEFKN